MSRACRTCQHLKRPEIDRRLAAGEPSAQVARDYDLNASSLHRHRTNCLKLGSSNAIMRAPHRMGAALTYARRYALFTLVGIAEEDDLDAPDLGAAPKACADVPPRPNGGLPNGPAFAEGRPTPEGPRRRPSPSRPARPVLAPDQSAALRDRLVAELDGLQSADEAAGWAHRSLPIKNTLTAPTPTLSKQASG
jgi:ERF superfamily